MPPAAWTTIVCSSATVSGASPVSVEPVSVPFVAVVTPESSTLTVSAPPPASSVSRPPSWRTLRLLSTLIVSLPVPVVIDV